MAIVGNQDRYLHMQNNAEFITALAVADVGSSLNNLPETIPT